MFGSMRLQEKLLIIDEMPLFSNLSVDDKRTIAKSSLLVEYKKDDIVYNEGDPPDSLYCVVTGRLKAYIRTHSKEAEELEYLRRGKYFGVISLLSGEPHSVTVQAINDSVILKILKDDFDIILKRIPELAIQLGQMLSRRLKRKDLHEKKVFESTIISVFGMSDKVGATTYAVNLAIALKAETNKKIILLKISKTGPLSLDSQFFEEAEVARCISKHPHGVDMISIASIPKEAAHMISLLSYLTNDYHYILVDLPAHMNKTVFESLKQSDSIHIVTGSSEMSLRRAGKLIAELKKSSPDIGGKIKVITSEYAVSETIDFATKRAALNHDIYATLPETRSKHEFFTEDPHCEYSKTIRRIAREVGGCLIGLALGSGAALGMAHVGILKVLEAEGIHVDIVAGTSMGALIGALWLSGKDASSIETIVLEFESRIKTLRLVDLTLPKKGLIKGREVRRFLRSQFGDKTFYDLKAPFKIVACDIERREEVVLDRGGLADAVMASVAIPGVFEPVEMGGRLLVDGGIINPLPTNVLMRLGVAKIVAVNTLPSPQDIQGSKKRISNIFDFIVNGVQASEYLLAEAACQNVDIAMHPVLPSVNWYEFYKGRDAIKRGEEEALKYIDQLKELARI